MSQLKIRTNKACRLLGMFLLARIQQQQDAKEMSQLASEINYNYDNILIQETSKPIIQNFKKRKKSLCINTPIVHNKNERNINHIIISLANFKGFVKYIKYQNLSKEDLRKTAEVLKHEFYKKGSYIFRENDKSDAFYGVISGKVSIRKASYIDLTQRFHDEYIQEEYEGIYNHHNNDSQHSIACNISCDNFISIDGIEDTKYRKQHNKTYKSDLSSNFGDEFEYEIVTASKGMCFGEWGVVYNIPRTASAYCPEDTHVFKLEKEHFDQVLGNKFFQSDMNKIKFILQKLPILHSNYNFKYLLTKITPLFYDKGTLVYTTFDKAENIYLIYQGECSYVHLNDVKTKDDFLMKQHDIKSITSLSVGAITGLEAYKKQDLNYENNLLVTKDFTVLFTINIDYISTKIKDFNDFIKPLYELQCKIINDNLHNLQHNNIHMSIKDKYGILSLQQQQKQMETDINVIRNAIQYDKKVNSTSNKNIKKYKLFKINTNSFVERNRNIKSAIKTHRYNKETFTKDIHINNINTYRDHSFCKQKVKKLHNIMRHSKRLTHVNTVLSINTTRNKQYVNSSNSCNKGKKCFMKVKCNGVLTSVNKTYHNTEHSSFGHTSSVKDLFNISNKLLMNCNSDSKHCLIKPKSIKSISGLSNYSTYMKSAKEVKIFELTERSNSLPHKNKLNINKHNSNYNNKYPCNYGDITTSMIHMIYKRNKQTKHKVYNSGKFTLPLVSKIANQNK